MRPLRKRSGCDIFPASLLAGGEEVRIPVLVWLPPLPRGGLGWGQSVYLYAVSFFYTIQSIDRLE